MKGLRFILHCTTDNQSDYLKNIFNNDFKESNLTTLSSEEMPGDFDLAFVFLEESEEIDLKLEEAKEKYANLPIILITSSQNEPKVENYLDNQVQDYLINGDFDAKQVKKTVTASLKRWRTYQDCLKASSDHLELLNHIKNSIDQVTYEWDVFRNEIHWSDNIYSILGYRPGDISNIQKWMSKSHPDELKDTTENLEIALSGKEKDTLQRTYQVKKATGEYVLMEDKIKIIKNSKGHVCKIIGVLTDITKQNEAKIRAAKSEDNYTRIFNQGPMAMLIFRLEDLMIININRPALNMYKYPVDKFIGRKVDFLVSQENIYTFNHALSKIERNGEPQPLGQWSHIGADGDEIDVEVIGRSIEIDGSLCIMISCNNISLRVKALNELQKANEQFELIKKATHDIIWDYDVVNDKLNLDYKFQNAFGYTREELDIDLETWHFFIHPADSKNVAESLLKTLKDREKSKWQASYRVRRKDDNFTQVEDHAIIVRNCDGEAERVIGSIRDISERKEKDRQLLILQNSLEQISDSILITEANPIDKPGPRIVYANEAFYRQTGYTAEEVLGETPRILQGEKTDRAELDKLKTALTQKKPCTIELLNYKKNGEEFFVELTVDPVFDDQGNCEFFTSVQRDITERKEKENENLLFKRLSVGINEFSSIKERYEFVISMVTDHIGFDAAEGWITSVDKNELQRIGTYYKNQKLDSFFKNTEPITFEKSVGLPGTAWNENRMVTWNNLDTHEHFVRNKEIAKTSLKSAVAVPIYASSFELIGIIVLYSKESVAKLSRTAKNILNTISERFGSELQRMRLANEFSSFFNITPDLMCVMSKDGYLKKANTAFTNLTGFDEEEIKRIRALDFVHKDDREQTRKEFRRIIHGQNKISDYFECRYKTKSGKIINLVWTSIYDPVEKVVYAVAKNITDQKMLQQQVLSDSNLQKHVINSTEGYIWAIDRNYKLILANEAYLTNMKRYTGKSYQIGQKVISKTSEKWAIEDAHKQLWSNNYKKALAGDHVDFIYKTTANGVEVNQAISMRPIDSIIPGELPIGVACFSKDITDSVKYTEEIESKNLQLSEIAHIQAHNVRGPLSRILGLANLLLSCKNDNGSFNETLHKLLASANELDVVIRDIVNRTYSMDLPPKQNNNVYRKSG